VIPFIPILSNKGIHDGFLAPYKVLRVSLNIDLEGWRPEKGKTDKHGQLVDDRIYNRKDFDKNLVIDAYGNCCPKSQRIPEKTNRFDKTIFCVDIDHAQRMRAAIANENSGPDGKKQQIRYADYQ
jgi:type I restriction enzyme, R subunit